MPYAYVYRIGDQIFQSPWFHNRVIMWNQIPPWRKVLYCIRLTRYVDTRESQDHG